MGFLVKAILSSCKLPRPAATSLGSNVLVEPSACFSTTYQSRAAFCRPDWSSPYTDLLCSSGSTAFHSCHRYSSFHPDNVHPHRAADNRHIQNAFHPACLRRHCHRDAGVGHVIRFNIRVCLLADALIAHLIFQHVTGFGVNNDVILPLEAKRGAA